MIQTKRYDNVTVYYDDQVTLKASILYFHGGGFLYGSREDLPELHISTITQAGYAILSYDYPLAPAATLEVIHMDVCDSVNNYLANTETYVGSQLPYFLCNPLLLIPFHLLMVIHFLFLCKTYLLQNVILLKYTIYLSVCLSSKSTNLSP